MRVLTFASVVALTFEITFSGIGHASESLPKTVNTQLPYPAGVSLMHDPMGWTFRQSGTHLPLYFNEKDSPDKSVCNSECEKQWIPLLVTLANEKSLGQWTIFVRKDGRLQWAFKNRPVYSHIHDTPGKPNGDDVDGVWHLMPHFRS